MSPMLQRFISTQHNLFAILALGAASSLSVSMVLVRAAYTGQFSFRFVLWNLFLAWVPLFVALLAKRARGWFSLISLAATWLLFFPNAPYVLTDLVHFRPRETVPYWYDLILLVSFIWAGVMTGFYSLFILHQRMNERFGELAGWVFTIVTLGLSSFGIYLGRFLRWNSWDVVFNPDELARDIWLRIANPFDHPRAYVFSFLLAAFLVAAYLTLYSFARLPREEEIK
jgi:uncharacterized membrane protein